MAVWPVKTERHAYSSAQIKCALLHNLVLKQKQINKLFKESGRY